MNLSDVYCDFDLNSSAAWTLVQSYELRNTMLLQKKPFFLDFPANEISPNWDGYRLSKSRIQTIQEDSTKFRVTCNYDTEGVVYRDYLQATKSEIDILTLNSLELCLIVEWINIRGQSCKQCTAFIAQDSNHGLHGDSFYAVTKGCEFQPNKSSYCDGIGEDNFGSYLCINKAHRCSSSPSATTQTWLGGD